MNNDPPYKKRMNFEINDNICEICGQQARVGMNDKDFGVHYSCLVHVDELYHKLNI